MNGLYVSKNQSNLHITEYMHWKRGHNRNILEKILSTMKVSEISITTTIAVSGLVVSLVACVAQGADITITTSIASGLTGYIGGRTQGK